MKRTYYIVVYYLSWVAFAFFGLLLNLVCTPLLLVPRRARLSPVVRSAIRRMFDFWVRWFHASGVLRLTWHGFDRPLEPGVVYVANHPSLVDATFLMARLPDAFCIFKRKLMNNPVVGPAALMAGYVSEGNPVDALRAASAAVAAGQSFLVFPEGTRTSPGVVLEPLKYGFALVAHRAHAPVQLILIRTSEGLVPRGRPWWVPPKHLPGAIDVWLDQRWAHDPSRSPKALAESVEKRMQEALGGIVPRNLESSG